jgi:hypothetical protein
MQPFPKERKVQVLFGVGESKPKGGTMRRLLLLLALCMALALVLSAPAMAQSASASPPAGEGNPCFGQSAECYAEFGIDPPASVSPSADPCPDPNFPRETPDGCQASDLPDVEFGPDASPTASPVASPTALPSATASATAESSVSALPETGGPSPTAFALPSLVLLVAGGIFAARLVRR